MSVQPPSRLIDERFFDRRRRSTSIAGMVGAVVAGGLFLYRLYVDHVVRWDLFAVLLAIVVVKMGLMLWYSLTD